LKFLCPPCEFQVPENAPEKVLRSVGAWGKLSARGLRLLGHPGLLAIAEALHGPDFCPFSGANEEMIVKVAGLRRGPSVILPPAFSFIWRISIRGSNSSDE
jgi:hypothetical protein